MKWYEWVFVILGLFVYVVWFKKPFSGFKIVAALYFTVLMVYLYRKYIL